MSDGDLIDTGIPTARIATLSVAGPAGLAVTALVVTWADGARAGRIEIIDVIPVIGAYKVYRPLRGNPKLFATARLIDDGYAVAWDGSTPTCPPRRSRPMRNNGIRKRRRMG